MLKKRIISLILAVTVMMTAVAGCQTSGNKNSQTDGSTAQSNTPVASEAGEGEEYPPVTIEHWFWVDSDYGKQVFLEIVDEFNKTNDKNITVKAVDHPWSGGQYSEDLFTVAMGGGAPDTAGFKLTATPLFVANNFLEPLDSYLENWDKKDDVDESIYDILRGVTEDGSLYLMPWNIQVLFLFYRPSLFEAANVQIPETYEEFLTACRTLTRDTNGDGKTDVYGYGMRGSKGGQEPWGSFIYARGGSFDDLTSAASIQGMQDYIDLFQEGCVPPSAPNDGASEIIANFNSGLVAMTTMHIGAVPLFEESCGEDMGGFNFPVSPDGRWTSMGDTETVMFSSSENKEAAFEWISYLAAEKGQEVWCTETKNIPVSKTVQAVPAIKENEFMQISIEGIPYAGIIPVRDTTTEWISTLWPNTIQQALLGDVTAQQAMEILDQGLFGQ